MGRVFFPGLAAGAWLGTSALYILDLHQPQVTQQTVHDHGLGLAHHGVTGVVVRQTKNPAGLLHLVVQGLGLCQGVGHGLVANDIHAMVQREHGEPVVAVVGGHDGHKVCTIAARGLGTDERLPVGVAAIRRNADA